MKKISLIVALLSMMSFIAGCSDDDKDKSSNNNNSSHSEDVGGNGNVVRPGSGTQPGANRDPQTGDPCGQYTEQGVCVPHSNTRLYCDPDTNTLVRKDCDHGCMLDDDDYAICIIPCNDVTEEGICDKEDGKDVLKYCYNNGTKESLIISVCDASCGLANGRYDCLDKPAGDSCNENRFKGTCNPITNEITVCKNKKFSIEKCPGGCMVDGNQKATCKVPCGDIDEAGKCSEDNVLQYCYKDKETNDETLITADCRELGKVCQMNEESKFNTCVDPGEPAPEGCGNITDAGICRNGKEVVYCKDGKLAKYTCETACSVEGGVADCTCGSVTKDGTCQDQDLVYCDTEHDRLIRRTCALACVDKPGRYADCFDKECGSVTANGTCLSSTEVAFCDEDFGYKTLVCESQQLCITDGTNSNCQ